MKRNFLMILLCLLTISLCMFCLAACDTDGKSDVSQSSGGYTNEDNTHESESNNNHEEDSNNNADDNNSDEDNSDDNNSDSGEKEHVHQWGEWKVTKQATCTSKGEETRVCELDSTHKETREVAVNPKAHKLVHHNEKAATCSEKGWKAYDECSLCHYSTKVEIPKDSNAHQFVHQKEQEANCSSAGWSAYDKCELCGYEKGKTNYPINRDKHTFGKDNICTGCKTKWVYTENLSYKLNSNKTAYSVSGMGTATGTAITIPYYYNNLPVTAIESSAFKNYTRITSVTLPDSVTTIETMAFYGCNSINRKFGICCLQESCKCYNSQKCQINWLVRIQ